MPAPAEDGPQTTNPSFADALFRRKPAKNGKKSKPKSAKSAPHPQPVPPGPVQSSEQDDLLDKLVVDDPGALAPPARVSSVNSVSATSTHSAPPDTNPSPPPISTTSSRFSFFDSDRKPRASRQKARKERKEAAAEAVREEARAEVEASPRRDAAAEERRRLDKKCHELGVYVVEMNPDGHCLYAAIADQLRLLRLDPTATYLDTRAAAASYMRENPDEFIPFLIAHELFPPVDVATPAQENPTPVTPDESGSTSNTPVAETSAAEKAPSASGATSALTSTPATSTIASAVASAFDGSTHVSTPPTVDSEVSSRKSVSDDENPHLNGYQRLDEEENEDETRVEGKIRATSETSAPINSKNDNEKTPESNPVQKEDSQGSSGTGDSDTRSTVPNGAADEEEKSEEKDDDDDDEQVGENGLMSKKQFYKYCDNVENTSEWGGHPEILALAKMYKTPIHILQADYATWKIGETEPDELTLLQRSATTGSGGLSSMLKAAKSKSWMPGNKVKPMRISYHRRMYGLGEHYNSLRPRQPVTPTPIVPMLG